MAIALAKYGMFGWKLQSAAEGTPGFETPAGGTGWNWCPMAEDPTFAWTPNLTPLDQADRSHFEHLVYSRGAWYAGTVTIHLCPGVVSNLILWLQDRDTYNQGKFASVYIHQPIESSTAANIIAARNVKVISAEFPFERGEPVRVSLELVGLHDLDAASKPTVATDYVPAADLYAPYIWKDITFGYRAGAFGGAYPTNYDIRDGTIRIDNSVDDPEEGLRFDGTNSPYRLYNNSGIRCTGSFSRDYVDATVYDAFRRMAGATWYDNTLCPGLTATIARGTTLTMTVPRIAYTEHNHGIRGSRVGSQEESVDWIALGAHSYAGATPATTEKPIHLS